jgi:hypothetical protein
MENWVNKGNKEEPFFYIKIALLSDQEKIKYSEPVEYRVYLTLPDGQYTAEVEVLVDISFNIMDVRCTSSRHSLFFDIVTKYKNNKVPVSSLLLALRKLYEKRYGAAPKTDYSHR